MGPYSSLLAAFQAPAATHAAQLKSPFCCLSTLRETAARPGTEFECVNMPAAMRSHPPLHSGGKALCTHDKSHLLGSCCWQDVVCSMVAPTKGVCAVSERCKLTDRSLWGPTSARECQSMRLLRASRTRQTRPPSPRLPAAEVTAWQTARGSPSPGSRKPRHWQFPGLALVISTVLTVWSILGGSQQLSQPLLVLGRLKECHAQSKIWRTKRDSRLLAFAYLRATSCTCGPQIHPAG